MRFIEAFLTSKGSVGMQFSPKAGVIFTVYRDHEGKLVFTEGTNYLQQSYMEKEYLRREKWYRSKKA